MLRMIRLRGHRDAAVVTGYRERSYNIGYCETCSEMVTDVRIYYRTDGGADTYYQVGYKDLGKLIRELTGGDTEQAQKWDAAASREPEGERWDRESVHSFDEEPAD